MKNSEKSVQIEYNPPVKCVQFITENRNSGM